MIVFLGISSHKEEKCSLHPSLRPSLFPHVPPYIKFFPHDQKGMLNKTNFCFYD